MRTGLVVAIALAASSAAANAAFLTPVSYSMTNGGSGSYVYRDTIYTGPGATGNPNADYSSLSGGLGKLTDGVVGGNNILNPIVNNETPAWVGWRVSSIGQITIVFDFAQTVQFNTLAIHVANFSPFGDVSLPSLSAWDLSNNGTSWDNIGVVVPTQQALSNPDSQWLLLTPLGATNSGRYARLTLQYGTQPWIFASEAQFTGVPTPGVAAFFGVAGLAAARRRR